MKSAQDWLNEYAESHQHPTNIIIHWVCVPLIMLSIIGLLANIQLGFTFLYQFDHYGTLLIFLGCIYYFILSKALLIGMLPVSILMLFCPSLGTINFLLFVGMVIYANYKFYNWVHTLNPYIFSK